MLHGSTFVIAMRFVGAAVGIAALILLTLLGLVYFAGTVQARDRTNLDVGVGINIGPPLFGGMHSAPVPVYGPPPVQVIPPIPIYEEPRYIDVGPRYNHGPNLNCRHRLRPFRIMDDANRVVGWICPP